MEKLKEDYMKKIYSLETDLKYVKREREEQIRAREVQIGKLDEINQ